jgi:hypothetical protein
MKNLNKKQAALGVLAFLVILFVYFWPKDPEPKTRLDFNNKNEWSKEQSNNPSFNNKTSIDARNGIAIYRRLQEQEARALEKQNVEEATEKQRLENWKANFPYEPTYHQTLKYDPSRYDPNNPATFTGDPEMETAVKNHGYMVAFYNNPQIYTAEFEQLYHMLKEIDRAENPMITGDIFSNLRCYHQCKRKDQNALYSKKTYVPSTNESDPPGKMVPVLVPIDGKTTWGDQAKSYHDAIVGLLVRSKYWPNKELLDADVARAFRDRLINEIPSENFVKMQPIIHLPNGDIGAFAYHDSAEKALKPGDKLLIR